jgi:hypothetical protein
MKLIKFKAGEVIVKKVRHIILMTIFLAESMLRQR